MKVIIKWYGNITPTERHPYRLANIYVNPADYRAIRGAQITQRVLRSLIRTRKLVDKHGGFTPRRYEASVEVIYNRAGIVVNGVAQGGSVWYGEISVIYAKNLAYPSIYQRGDALWTAIVVVNDIIPATLAGIFGYDSKWDEWSWVRDFLEDLSGRG